MRRTALRNARSRTVGVATAKFATALVHRKTYRISCDVDFWYKFDVTGGAVAASADDAVWVAGGDGSHVDTPLDGDKLFLHVIRAGAVDGVVNIAEVDEI